MDIVLYYAPNTCALAPYITLTEAGAAFEVRSLDFGRDQHLSADYVKINPKHKVPLLVVDGQKLTESTAIQLWISRQFPDARLLPSDPWDELKAISTMSWCSSGIHPYLTRINNTSKVCDVPDAHGNVRTKAEAFLQEAFVLAEEMLTGREFFFDRFTAPDAHFFWCCRRATQFEVDLAPFTNTAAHFARMHDRPSVQKLLAFEAEVKAEFQSAA